MRNPATRFGRGYGGGQRFVTTAFLPVLLAVSCAAAADWPMFRHDPARSGATDERLQLPLAARWVYRPRHAPAPAWGKPNPRPVGGWFKLREGQRARFDDAFPVAVAGGAVYFGSSADGQVCCLDADTGTVRWRVYTGGPVRLAPQVVGDRVYVGSDDGYVYCLRAGDGGEVWKFRAAPGPGKLLGSGQMISRWPVRTGVLVAGETAYAGAGIFPAAGVFLYALDAKTGTQLWCNDACGADPHSRISPQGHLLASDDTLYVPMGRVSPAGFDRKTGRLLHQTYFSHHIGGTYALLAGKQLITGTGELVSCNRDSRSRFAWYHGSRIIVRKTVSYLAGRGQIKAIDLAAFPRASIRRRQLFENHHRTRIKKAGIERKIKKLKQSADEMRSELADLEKKAGDPEQRDGAIPPALARRIEAVRGTLEAKQKEIEKAQKNPVFKRLETLKKNMKTAADAAAGCVAWAVESDCAAELILAGDTLFAGGDGKVAAVDTAAGKVAWTGAVDGAARGLAVAGGRLYVSTDTGTICCFGSGTAGEPKTIRPADPGYPGPDDRSPLFAAAAKHIIDATGIRRGYALVLGSGSGRLALRLARLTDLTIYGIETDPAQAARSRRLLRSAGLYGRRVRIEVCTPGAVPYANYCADLVVSESVLTGGTIRFGAAEAFRMLKPCGGRVCIGRPAGTGGAKPPAAALKQWAAGSPLAGGKIETGRGTWLTYTRGPLPEAGRWTHQYADPGNTACSDDRRIRCPLGLLWFGDPGPGQMPERHRRAAAPLAAAGRLFIQGEGPGAAVDPEKVIMCYDAYNGVKYWERRLPNTLRDRITHNGGNAALGKQGLFIAAGDTCLRLDAETGKTAATYALPAAKDGKNRSWGYLALDGDTLYGSRSIGGRKSDAVFAVDPSTGDTRWVYTAGGIPQGAIAVGDGTVFLATADVTPAERRRALATRRAALETLDGDDRRAAEKKLQKAAVRAVVALDAATGRPRWRQALDLVGAAGGFKWCSLGSMYKDGVLVLFGVYVDGHFWKEFFAGKFKDRLVTALSAQDGSVLWRKKIGYRVRPLVIGDTLHAEPWAFDLRTGRRKTRTNPITGLEEPWQFARPGHHCGCPAAAPHLMVFRSFTLGWYDLVRDYGTKHFPTQRPGCWINMVPANGLLMVPEASSGCLCPFPNACTVVFEPVAAERGWAWSGGAGDPTPVKRLALNLGAPGDRVDDNGRLWLGYPRHRGSLVRRIDADVSLYPGGQYVIRDPAFLSVKDTSTPWVYRSGARGLRRLSVPLVGPGDGAARYTVRLAFAETDGAAAGRRVFGVSLQGRAVADGVDIAREAGGPNRALVKEFNHVDVEDELTVALTPAAGNKPTRDEMPLLQGIEIVREKVLSLGVRLPAITLRDAAPKATGRIRIANFTARPFAGTVELKPPPGFAAAVERKGLRIPPGKRVDVGMTVRVVREGTRGTRPLTVLLVGEEGRVAWEGTADIEYLAGFGRITAPAVADAWVVKGSPGANREADHRVMVDGGNPKPGDAGRAVAYLAFRFTLPGKPTAVRLRLYNAGNPTGDSGRVCLVDGTWEEKKITYDKRPRPGKAVATIGRVAADAVVELPLDSETLGLDTGACALSVALVPSSCDGVNYVTREGGRPAELIVEYEE